MTGDALFQPLKCEDFYSFLFLITPNSRFRYLNAVEIVYMILKIADNSYEFIFKVRKLASADHSRAQNSLLFFR